jgi:hypothetical protein
MRAPGIGNAICWSALQGHDGKLRPCGEWRLVGSDADRNQLFVIRINSQKVK